MINKDIIKNIRNAPELEDVEIIHQETDRIELTFKPGSQRTGKELLKVQSILHDEGIHNFIRSEKVELWTGIIKKISISFY